jgi:hypothetical protein
MANQHDAVGSSPGDRLSPELRGLPDEALQIWANRGVRNSALNAIVDAWQRESPDLDGLVGRVDAAVAAGMKSLGLPRGTVLGVRIEASLRFSAGRKHPDCWLVINGRVMRDIVRVHGDGDDFLRTWVHESLHARQPYSPNAANEARLYQGYEEGMVEGLARLIVRDRAGLRPLERSYTFYVAAYEAVATVAGVRADTLWRALWLFPAGEVRAAFVDAVDTARREASGRLLTMEQRSRLRAVADRLFATSRRDELPARDVMLALWRIALT